MPTSAMLQTPCLVLDEARMQRNIARIHGRLAGSGVAYRAHLKTAKSIEVARRQMLAPGGPAMVSTLREAEVFAEAGVTDLTYGVGIAPDKLDRVLALRRRGVDIGVILDSVAQAEAVAAASSPALPLAALIEIDCDGHRSGVAPQDSELLLAIAQALAAGGRAPRGADACRRELRAPAARRRSRRRRSRSAGRSSTPPRRCAPRATPARWSASARRPR